MKQYLHRLSFTLLFTLLYFGWSMNLNAQTANNVYFIPLPDDQVHSSLKVFTDGINKSIGNEMRTIISLTCTEDNATIYYDHREDGYEADIPSCLPNQNSNTQIK